MTFMQVLALAAMSVIFSWPNPVMQKRDRMVKKVNEGFEAVQLNSIEVNGKPIEAGKKFTASDDWLKGLKIKGENISDKAIVNIIIELSFEQIGLEDFVYSVAHGVMPQSAEEAKAAKKIKPHETLEIILSEAVYDNLRTMLTQRGYPNGVEAINISIGVVTFDDYTLWRHGKLLRPDPNNPKAWKVVRPAEKESSAPRTR